MIVFIPNLLNGHGENTLDLVMDLSVNSDLDLDILVVTSTGLDTTRAWLRLKADQAMRKIYIIPDKCGHIVRAFGVLDTDTKEAYSSMFVSDSSGCVQGSAISSQVKLYNVNVFFFY